MITLANTRIRLIPALASTVGLALLLLNVYGEIRGMRVAELIPAEDLRFENDLSLGYDEAIKALRRLDGESDRDHAVRVNGVVQRSMAHPRQWHGHPPDRWNQRIPFTENPYLHVVGRVSGLPQFERYHFADYRKSLERGIGVCGDHTLILSQVLDLSHISNSLLSFPGHVLAEVRFDDDSTILMDPDFGVVVEADAEALERDPSIISDAYRAAGYSEKEINSLQRTFAAGYVHFDNAYSFMELRWWFEHVSYIAKWVVPLALLALVPMDTWLRRRRDVRHSSTDRFDDGSALQSSAAS